MYKGWVVRGIGVVIAGLAAGQASGQTPTETVIEFPSFNGTAPNGRFGENLELSYDLTLDSVPEIFIDAPGSDIDGQTNGGRVNLTNPTTMVANPVDTFSSPMNEMNGEFGASATYIEDINFEGDFDFVFGAPGENGTIGRVYIVGSEMEDVLRTIENPASDFDLFGATVLRINDINGDEFSDIAIAAPEAGGIDEASGTANAGLVYAFDPRTGVELWRIQSPSVQANGYFGASMAHVDDTDDDALHEIIAGAPRETVGGLPNAGRAYLLDTDGPFGLMTFESPNPEVGGNFGYAVAGLHDIDGDGLADVLIGAPIESPAGVFSAGRAYIFSGATG